MPFPLTTFTSSSQRVSAHLKALFLHNCGQLMAKQATHPLMTVQEAQVFTSLAQFYMPAHTSHQCLPWPCYLLWPVQGIRRGQGLRVDPKLKCKWNRKLFQQMTDSPSVPEREVFILKRVEEHIHPPHPLLLLQKESFIGKEFFNILKHTKERSLLQHFTFWKSI